MSRENTLLMKLSNRVKKGVKLRLTKWVKTTPFFLHCMSGRALVQGFHIQVLVIGLRNEAIIWFPCCMRLKLEVGESLEVTLRE